jgi:bzd-type benzoyl-CoA reductase N subunit
MRELDRFMEIVKTTCNETMKAWKEGGGRIVGYFCTNVPEELIMAAGMLPYRVRSPESRDTSEADRYTTYLNCTYCRHVVDDALLGNYDFLDGFVGSNGCDQMRRVSDIFRAVSFKEAAEKDEFFLEYVGAPRVPMDEASLKYYKDEIIRMKEQMEEFFDVQITEDKLNEAIREVNESRRLLHELYELRKAEQPPITGAEALSVTVAYTCMPKDQFNRELKALLAGLGDRKAAPDHKKRLFLYGSELDDPDWVKLIEDQGALVVADGTCFGGRMFWDFVDESSSPIEALAKRYHERWSCPRMCDRERRQDKIKEMVRDWNADGIVGERIVFCQLWGSEKVMTNLEAQDSGTPTLWLEREYLLGGTGQIKTRVQAFLESME